MDFRSSSTLFVSVAAAVRTGVSMGRCTAALSTHTARDVRTSAPRCSSRRTRGGATHTTRRSVDARQRRLRWLRTNS